MAFGNRIEALISQLESAIPDVDEGMSFFKTERNDWRPVWDICRDIQTEFNGFRGFKSREEHQAAWERFQTLRQRASRLADLEKDRFANQSERLKIDILSDARNAYWSASADFFVGAVLGHTTIEELQGLQALLNSAGRKLSNNKHLMTREDKEACYAAMQDARASHDRFFEKYKELKEERRRASQQKREEYERKRLEWIDRVQSNIRRNTDKLERAQGALERTRDRIQEIEDKLRDTTSSKWEGIFSDWLSEAQSKERDIEESIDRIREWIREDESKLNDA